MRNATIDISKGIGILSVVLCHNWIAYNNHELNRIIYSFHMPLFFFIAGIFFNPNSSFKLFVSNKFQSLLKPYFVVLLVLFLFNYFFNFVTKTSFDNTKYFFKLLYGSSSTLNWAPLWFLPHLFLVFIAGWFVHHNIFRHLQHSFYKVIFLSIMLLVGMLTIQTFWLAPVDPFGLNLILYNKNLLHGLPFDIDIILVTLPFFMFGALCAKKMQYFQFNIVYTALSLVIFIVLHYSYNYSISFHLRQYDDFMVSTLQIITGIYLVFFIASLCTKFNILSKVLSYLGQASLFILIFHYPIQRFIIFNMQFHLPQFKTQVAFVAMVISIVCSVMLWQVIQNYSWLKTIFLPKKIINAKSINDLVNQK